MWENRAVTPVQMNVQPFHALQNVAQVAHNVAQSVAQSVSQNNSAQHTTQFHAVALDESMIMQTDAITQHAESILDVESLQVSDEQNEHQFAYTRQQRRPLHAQLGLFSVNMFGTSSGLPTPRAHRAYGASQNTQNTQNTPWDIQASAQTHATPYACEDVDMPDAELGNSAC